MQKKGYSPQAVRGLENVWDTLLRYASTVPETLFNENFRGEFLQTESTSVKFFLYVLKSKPFFPFVPSWPRL